MRAVSWLRNYALFVFFLLLVGGVILKPGGPTDTASTDTGNAGAVYRAG